MLCDGGAYLLSIAAFTQMMAVTILSSPEGEWVVCQTCFLGGNKLVSSGVLTTIAGIIGGSSGA